MAQYGKPEYWDQRYTADKESFDWYQRYSGLKPLLSSYIQNHYKILHVGCGTSRLPEDMYDDGYQNITNMDISSVGIELMKARNADARADMKFEVMDITSMSYPTDAFNVVVDKGTIDSLLCGENSTVTADKALSEISRVTNETGGVFIMISHGQPNYRLPFLTRDEYKWEVKVSTVDKPPLGDAEAAPQVPVVDERDKVHYIYTCEKKTNSTTHVDSPVESPVEKEEEGEPVEEATEEAVEEVEES